MLKMWLFCVINMKMGSESKFLKVRFPRCGNEQVVFGKTTERIKCERCNKLLVKVGGGKARMRVQVLEILG